MAGGKRRHWLIAAAAAGGLAICLAAWLLPGEFVERLRLATRLTARWSGLWFLALFVARPMHQMFGGLWSELTRQRRYLGLGFAAAHTIHGACFLWLVTSFQDPRPLTVVIGGAGYLFMFAMAATSNDAAMRALGRNWKRLHTAGIWLLWFIFIFTLQNRIAMPEHRLTAIVLTALFALAALIRIPAVRRLIRPVRPAPQPQGS